ncbi:hypothetical protein FA95DRAFT_1681503 [Auriscalpium vulgare]|uniref:Uncharacterized protein n=1 Tax=Auriscalpium vulgare TaxID=40419 RepID=A0ACB8RJV6_9AGAM|nr:hypothetical protein FA95DRAFT_1681503 [Auriscalpium vulgare]
MNGFQFTNLLDIFPRRPFYNHLAWLAGGGDMNDVEPSAQTSGFQSFVSDQAIDDPNAIAVIGPPATFAGYDTYNATPFELATPASTEIPSVEQEPHYPPPHFYEADEPVPSSLLPDIIPTHQPINHPDWGQAYSSPYCSGLGAPPPTLSRKSTPPPLHLPARLPGDRQSHVKRREQRRRGPYTRSESTRSTTGGPWTPESPAFPTTPPSASSSASAHVHVLSPSGEPTCGAYAGWPSPEYIGATRFREMQDIFFFAEDFSLYQSADPSAGGNDLYDVMPVISSGGMGPSTAGYDFGTPEIAAGVAHTPKTRKFENGDRENEFLGLPVQEALLESVAGPSTSTRASTQLSWQLASGREEEWGCEETMDPQPFKCEVAGCDKKYKNKAGLKRHARSHSGRTWDCDWCHAELSRSDALKRHLRRVTKCAAKQAESDAQKSAE